MSEAKIINRHGSFTLVPNAFIKANVSHEAFRLYVVLLSHARGNAATEGGDVFPDYQTLLTKTRIKSFSTIAKTLRELESGGWLERKKRFGASTIYTLTSPTPGVIVDATPVLHGVESSPTSGVGQSYTPSQANNTQVTRHTEQYGESARASRDASPNIHKAIFSAIAEACMLDTTSTPNAARVGRAASWLARKPGIEPQQVQAFTIWFEANDWRGQKGERPSPELVQSEWAKFASGYKPKPKGATSRRQQASYTPEQRARKEREAAAALAGGDE